MVKTNSINEVLISAQQQSQDDILHYGILGMKWGKRKGRFSGSSGATRNPKTGGILRKFRKKDPNDQIAAQQHQDPRRKRNVKKVNDRMREDQFIYEYEHRDRMSTRAIEQRNKRIKAEREFESLVYGPQREREQAEKAKKDRRKKILTTAAVVGLNAGANYGFEKMFYRNGVRPENYGVKYDKDSGTYTGNHNNIKRYKQDRDVYESLKSTNDMIKGFTNFYSDFNKQINGGGDGKKKKNK